MQDCNLVSVLYLPANQGAMLVSHRYRFIYTKTLKTASTSVESYFERYCMPEGEWKRSEEREPYESPTGIIGYRGPGPVAPGRWFNHMPAARIKAQIGADVWNNYFKFCVIRNPFDKVLSAFQHLGKNYSIPSDPDGLSFRQQHPSFTEEQLRFLHWLVFREPPIDRDKYLIDSVFCMDDVIRYETLESDLERICSRLKLPWEPSLLPKFKWSARRKEGLLSQLYTPPAIESVERFYRYELEAFGYSYLQSEQYFRSNGSVPPGRLMTQNFTNSDVAKTTLEHLVLCPRSGCATGDERSDE